MGQLRENIFLIGFMGCGKSTVSRYLQRQHKLTVLEMDEELERREGMKISAIFEQYGEPYFREQESGLLQELEQQHGLVVSCGGGVPLRTENVESMKRSGKVVFLTARPETILERVKNNHDRPLLENHKDVEYIVSLLEQRREKYEAAADFMVATDQRSAREIGEEVLQKMHMSQHEK